MLRTIQITLFAILLACAGTAMAALDILELAIEADVSNTKFPSGTAGQVAVRQCTGCEPQVWRVHAATSYHIGMRTRPVALDELRAAAASGQHEMVYVFYKPDTDEVTRVVLSAKHSAKSYVEVAVMNGTESGGCGFRNDCIPTY
ncbi:MAG: hypothetical protein KJO76_07735 [Gammaproteobacteria bacterium]|nr:hypothetical protein [Gammaproteobacteria bacterium]NND35920.1 hypothetical protein [Gammaproteobacteria bacterium]